MVITLTLFYRYMFWTDWGKKPRIERAGMDGQNRNVIIKDNIGWPNGLAVDKASGRIIWADARTQVLTNLIDYSQMASKRISIIEQLAVV